MNIRLIFCFPSKSILPSNAFLSIIFSCHIKRNIQERFTLSRLPHTIYKTKTYIHENGRINVRSLGLLNGLIRFKENILREVEGGRLFTTNYPLLIQHILREARLYRSSIESLMNNRQVSYLMLLGTENFWNQIMMEHALFIRGLLDPTEEALIQTANNIAMDFQRLLETAKERDTLANQSILSRESLVETVKIRDFKIAGTQGILSHEIASIILPLLADHVLREANHYIRILKLQTA